MKKHGLKIELTKSLREKEPKSKIARTIKLSFSIFIVLIIILLSLLYLSYLSQLEKKDVLGNFHTHTTNSDGKNSYDEMIEKAVSLDMDFIAITDHSKIGKDVLEKCPNEKRIVCILGEETFTFEGDLLAINIKEQIPSNIDIEETIKKIHSQGGFAMPSHPNIPGEVSHETLINIKDKIDGLECYNNKHFHQLDFFWLNRYSKKYNIPCVFNSDAHNIDMLEGGMNNCDIDGEITKENILKAVKEGKCKPRISSFVKYSYYNLGKLIPHVDIIGRFLSLIQR